MIHDFEIEEFAQELLHLEWDEDTWESTIEELEKWIYEKYEIDFDKFSELINDIFPYIEKANSWMSWSLYKWFSKDLWEWRKRWLIKVPV